MKVTVSFTPGEREQAQRVREMLLRMFTRCRTHTSQTGECCIFYLTVHF